jgi:PilZ domain
MREDRSKRTAQGAKPGNGEGSQPGKKRSVRRCPFVASAEVTDVSTGTKLSARTSELGIGGCYIETLNPFPDGELVHLRILKDNGVFETKAKVVYCHKNCGMGLAFRDTNAKQRLLLEDWLAEMVTQLRPSE